MFERYTEKARRVIFYSRFEASEYGYPNTCRSACRAETRCFAQQLMLESGADFEHIRETLANPPHDPPAA